MPGPYTRLDVPNINQHVVTAPPPKKAKKATATAAPMEADSQADKADIKPADK